MTETLVLLYQSSILVSLAGGLRVRDSGSSELSPDTRGYSDFLT